MIFLSDLDRTLIFSYKRLSPDNLCVEKKDGKELSYMTRRSAKLFSELTEKIIFIPITTRSKEQYERIVFPDGYVPRYAVIDNGANLLVDGVPDREWRKEFEEEFRRAQGEINECRKFLQNEKDVYFEIRIVDDSFLFTKAHNTSEVIDKMGRSVRTAHTSFCRNGEKLYVIPDGISKGRAADKILKWLPGHKLIAAGDSLFDRQMLQRADIAIIKQGELCGMEINPVQISDDYEDDPDFVLDRLGKIISGGGSFFGEQSAEK